MESDSEKDTKNEKHGIALLMKNENMTREHLLKQILAQQKKINGLEKIIAACSQTEDTLKTSEENLLDILENNADGIIIVDVDGTVLYVNSAAQKLFGKSKKDFIGYSFGFPVSTDKEENLLVIRKGGAFCEAELRVVRVQWKKQPAFQLSVRDITERKKVEHELKLKNVILSAQMETSIDGILVVDENGKIISFNMRFISLWDIPSGFIETKSDEIVLKFVADKVAAPDQFLKKVSYLYKHRDSFIRREGRRALFRSNDRTG
jgi:PAS domain-containing protein